MVPEEKPQHIPLAKCRQGPAVSNRHEVHHSWVVVGEEVCDVVAVDVGEDVALVVWDVVTDEVGVDVGVVATE